ncbi:MAG: hypothetical protein K0U86_11055 [Planctomycetes bacterium]|nr:hypothetical protein [Planctomycetota bacterium]MCH9725419.1 hypothetical protein [Planctomycetota bacterium]MCH9776516.1 hypothetical protein [Planctomycetota bacterium]MCH9790825.1 hypothetical protein [Planctomycetota bacterium]MDF1742105.1 hypothetical protein [Gimesia sp.]
MNYLQSIYCPVLALALMFTSMQSVQAENTKSKLVSVPKILKVTHKIQESHPPNLELNVTGQVPTSGYTDVQLLRMVYVQPPQDGIQDFYLKAIPPSGLAATVISQVTASKTWKGYPAWVKGIRVHGVKDGIVEIKFNKDPETPKPILRRFTGTSKDGSFETALTEAIAKLNKALPAGGVADATATWRVVRTSGAVGGITGQNQIRVIISAERQPAWPQKKRLKKLNQKKK